MYPGLGGGLLGAASQTMGTILSPFAAYAHRHPYLFPSDKESWEVSFLPLALSSDDHYSRGMTAI